MPKFTESGLLRLLRALPANKLIAIEAGIERARFDRIQDEESERRRLILAQQQRQAKKERERRKQVIDLVGGGLDDHAEVLDIIDARGVAWPDWEYEE